jgi:hypothetical protein
MACAMESSRRRLLIAVVDLGFGKGWTREDQETRVAHGVTSGLKINRRWVSAKGYFGAQNMLNNDF